jgi:ribosomal protein S18 acetylase RimI-like enzyme
MDTELTIRPARADDRAAMERICAQTWEWGDYVPQVWDDWLADTARSCEDEGGILIVGELAGRVVALSKITCQARGQVWLEGMRLDPDYRRRGIAGQFLDYSLAYAREHGARVVRLGTGHHNTAAHILAARADMERVGSCVYWLADPLFSDGLAGPPEISLLTLEDEAMVQTFLAECGVLAHTRGLYSVDWVWQELSVGDVKSLLERGQVVAWSTPDGQLAALATIHADREGDELWVGFADGEPDAVTQLARAIRMQAAQLGAERVQAMVPDLTWLREAYRAAGYGPGDWEGELLVFQHWPTRGREGSGGSHDG